MLAAFYASHRIPITIPLFIAMTALSRLIILQGKDGNPSILLYESGAIILIAGIVAIGVAPFWLNDLVTPAADIIMQKLAGK